MNEEQNPEMEKKWQDYKRRQKQSKILVGIGIFVICVSIALGIIPVAVSAFTGTVYVATPWSDYFGFGVIFGVILVIAGLIARISPNMVEGDALWTLKTGPYYR